MVLAETRSSLAVSSMVRKTADLGARDNREKTALGWATPYDDPQDSGEARFNAEVRRIAALLKKNVPGEGGRMTAGVGGVRRIRRDRRVPPADTANGPAANRRAGPALPGNGMSKAGTLRGIGPPSRVLQRSALRG